MKRDGWYSLDHSAKIWPAVLSRRFTSFFRLSVVLENAVVYEDLRKALASIQKRFPYFAVKFKRGFFWYYLEETGESLPLLAERSYPCMDFNQLVCERNALLVRAFGPRIILEMSHILSDGGGALEFLRALVYEYLRLRHGLHDVPHELRPKRPEGQVHNAEWSDSYLQHGMEGAPGLSLSERAFHLPHSLLPPGESRVISGYCSLRLFRACAKGRGVSISEYLVALLFMAYQDYWLRLRDYGGFTLRPIRILVPVNLRPVFNSESMRNFFVYVDPHIDPRLGRYEFQEIFDYVHHYMRGERHKQNLKRHFVRLARTERKLAVRIIPLGIKNLVFSLNFLNKGDSRFTTSFSNIGAFALPSDYQRYVRWADFYPPPSSILKQAVSVISCGDILSISFGKMIAGTAIERRFFRLLREQGCKIELSANIRKHGSSA